MFDKQSNVRRMAVELMSNGSRIEVVTTALCSIFFTHTTLFWDQKADQRHNPVSPLQN